MPPIPATGINTATKTRVVAITGAVIFFMASTVASFEFIPLAIFTCTASTTTMASSTTIPMASTNPNNESTLIVNPSMGKNMKAPIKDTGMARVGIRVALRSWMNINTTNTTRISAIMSVTTISLIPAVMGRVESRATSYLTLSGKFFSRSSISAIIFSANSTALDPGDWYKAIIAQVSRFMRGIIL